MQRITDARGATTTVSYNGRHLPTDIDYTAAGGAAQTPDVSFAYDAAGRQATASYNGIQHAYDGDGLRGKKVEDGYTTYYLRSSVLGGQVVGELNSGGSWTRGYVYAGWEQVAVQQSGAVYWTHTDPVTKSQRVTFNSSTVASTVDMDPWGGETQRSSNQNLQPHRYATYERDANGNDYAQARQYHGYQMRFDQPDPYDGSMSLAEPQSFNRYSYVQNDPVN